VWDLQAADPSASPRILSGHEGSISAIAFSRGGRWLISGGDDRTARVWKLADGDPLVVSNSIVLANHDDAVTSVAMSGDNQWAITMSGPTGRLWDISDEESNLPSSILSDEAGLPLSITAHAFSADNRLLAAGAADGTARVWDLAAGGGARQPRVLRGHDGAITAVAIRPGNRWVATSGGDKTIRLWNLAGAESIADPLVLPPIAAISPDHRWLVTRSQDHNVAHVWNLTTAYPLDNPAILSVASSQYTFLEVAFSPDSRWLMSGDSAGTARLWDLSGRRAVTQPMAFEGHRRVSALAMSPDQHWFVSGGFEGTARVWDLTAADPTMEPVILHPPVTTDDFGDAVYGVRISPDSRWLLIRRGVFSRSQLWELAAPAPAPSPVVLGAVDHISFSPDGRWLVVRGNSDERLSLTARIWEIADKLNASRDKVEREELDQELKRLQEEEKAPALLVTRLWDLTAQEPAIALTLLPEEWPTSYSPDGRWILTRVADGPLHLRDMTSADPGNDMRVFSDPADLSARIALEPALQWLATDDVTGSTRIQDLLEGASDSAFLNDASVGDFSLSEDGRWLVRSSDTDPLQLWDTQIYSLAEAPVALPEGMTGRRLIFVEQDAGGYRLLGSSYGSGGNTTLWTLPLDELIALACSTAGRNFSPAEWEQYFPDEPHRKTCRQWPMHPDLTQSLRDEARSLARQGDIAAAAGKFAEALHLDPDLGIDPEAEAKRIYAPTVVRNARALAAEGELVDAQVKFEEALALDPGLGIEPAAGAKRIHALKVVEEARSLAKRGEVVAAQVKFEEALHLDPDLGLDPEAEMKRIHAPIHARQVSREARDLAWQGEIVTAQVKFEEALALDPGLHIEPEAEAKSIYAPKVEWEARDLARQGDVAAATAKFEEALALDPGLDIEPDQDAMKLAAPALVQQTVDWAQQGAVTDALARLDDVKAIAFELNLPGLHLTICRLRSFAVLAEAVADVCGALVDLALVTESYQALAHPVPSIEPGLPVTGTVDSLFGDLWTLEVSAGSQVTITLSATASSRLDPYLALYDPGFRLVADTDNIAQGRRRDSALKNLTLTDGGLYWIVAGRCCPDHDHGSTGAYELEATVVRMETEE
jgi:WD40 repeat protein